MIKLYKKDKKGILHYAEAWLGVIHTGKVGKRGETENLPLSKFDNEAAFFDYFEKQFLPQDYTKFPDEEKHYLVVQFKMKSLKGNKRDLWLKDAVTDALNDELGWNGIGHVDGFDMGRTFADSKKYVLNIFCIVVDEAKGIAAIKRRLRENRLDYTQIKIAAKLFTSQDNYILKYTAKKNDLNFSL